MIYTCECGKTITDDNNFCRCGKTKIEIIENSHECSCGEVVHKNAEHCHECGLDVYDSAKIKEISKKWNIDEDIAEGIVNNNEEDGLGPFMYIDSDYEVCKYGNGKDLKNAIIDRCKEDTMYILSDLTIFCDGKKMDAEWDLKLKLARD